MFTLKYNDAKIFTVIICLGWISFGCRQPISIVQLHTEKKPQQHVYSSQMPADTGSNIYKGLKNPETVFHFYDSRHFEMVWINDSLSSLADSMVVFLKSIRLYGLLAQDYHSSEIENLNYKVVEKKMLQRKEALLTDAFLSIAKDLKYGRLESTPIPINVDSQTVQVLEYVLSHKRIKDALESQEPDHQGYQFLKKALIEILNSAEPFDREVLLSGITYDSLTLHKKVQQIEINMERWRKENSTLGNRYIWINIPSYQLQVVDSLQHVIESRIIVGKPESPTPILTSLVDCITLYPYWHVPRKIALEEFLPQIQKDTSFLTLNNFEVLDRKGIVLDPVALDWEKYNEKYFPVSLRQREGPDNSLGVIKFIFDNSYAVFLHDTNARKFFRKKNRALSHGCIRMEKAKALAEYLVPEAGEIEKILSLKVSRSIILKNPIPIYIRYFTCEFINGTLSFYDDIYRLDQELIYLLYKLPEVTPL